VSFERPAFLWLLVCIPVELIAAHIRIPALAASFGLLAGPARREMAVLRFRLSSICAAVLSSLFILASVFCLAGAAWGTSAVSAETSGLEIALVLDVSRSMEVNEDGTTRLDQARRVARQILGAAPGASFSLTAAKGSSVLLVPMTEDQDALDSALDYANPDTLTSHGSGLDSAIETALASFAVKDQSARLIVLFSDGGGQAARTEKAAELAGGRGVRIWAVGVGGDSALTVPGPDGSVIVNSSGLAVHSALAAGPLRRAAALSGGRYFDASDPGTSAALREGLAAMGRTGHHTVYGTQPRSTLFAGFALLFLCLRIAATLFAVKEPDE